LNEITQEDFNVLDFDSFVTKLQSQEAAFQNLKLAKKRLAYYKWKNTEELEKNILEFESNIKRTGGNVLWGNDKADSWNALRGIVESNARVAFVPGKIATEIELSFKHNIPSLSRFVYDQAGLFPDILFVQAKFLVSSTGHVFFATADRSEFEAVANAKKIVFLAGIDSFVSNDAELNLSKRLFSLYEIAEDTYPFQAIFKVGKPDARYSQQINVLIVDHDRSNLLTLDKQRAMFGLLNFELPKVVQNIFWPLESKNTEDALAKNLLNPFLMDWSKNIKVFMASSNLNKLNDFIPFDLNFYEVLIDTKSLFQSGVSNNLFSRLFKKEEASILFNPKKFYNKTKFQILMQEKLIGKNTSLPEIDKTFIEGYYYNKRKI
jgi:hypothetical protein